MLRHEMVTEAQALIEDPPYWTADRLTTLINRGMRDAANHFGVAVPGYFTFPTVVGQQQYMVPADFTANEELNFDANGTRNTIRIQPRPRSVYRAVADPTEQGTPYMGFFWAKEDRPELWIYPTFDTALTVDWFYWRRPPNIDLDNDEPLVPRDWHTYLVDYAVNYTLQQDQEKGWSYPIFYQWWKDVKMGIQIAEGEKDAASRDIKFGILDNQLPIMGREMFMTPDDWS